VSYFSRTPIRLATHGMTAQEARRWWADNAPPKGQYMPAEVGPALPCDTLSSGRHNAGKRRITRTQVGIRGGRTRLPVAEYYHQAHATRRFTA